MVDHPSWFLSISLSPSNLPPTFFWREREYPFNRKSSYYFKYERIMSESPDNSMLYSGETLVLLPVLHGVCLCLHSSDIRFSKSHCSELKM